MGALSLWGCSTQDDTGLVAKRFEFDRVFLPVSTQIEVYAEVHPLVVSAMDGYNVCICAYGQTGSGKTFTMEGVCGAGNSYCRSVVWLRALGAMLDTHGHVHGCRPSRGPWRELPGTQQPV